MAPSETADRLRRAGARVTGRRLMVAAALSPTRPSTAEQVLRRLRREDRGVGRATVFRTLDRLVEIGVAGRLEMEGHVYGYVSCRPEHHHHLVCTGCGAVEQLDERHLAGIEQGILRGHGFAVDEARLDFYGRCATCRREE